MNAPIGAVIGSAAGGDIAEDLYDRHGERIHEVYDPASQAVQGGFEELRDAARRTKEWIEERNAKLFARR